MSIPVHATIVQDYLAGRRTLEQAALALHELPPSDAGIIGWSTTENEPKMAELVAYMSWLSLRELRPAEAPRTPFTVAEWRAYLIEKEGLPPAVFDSIWGRVEDDGTT